MKAIEWGRSDESLTVIQAGWIKSGLSITWEPARIPVLHEANLLHSKDELWKISNAKETALLPPSLEVKAPPQEDLLLEEDDDSDDDEILDDPEDEMYSN